MKETKRVKYYWRYADDIVILAPNKEVLHELLHEIRAYLKGLKLRVKRNYQVFPVDSRGIDFLGYVFYHTHTLLRKSLKSRNFAAGGKIEQAQDCSKQRGLQATNMQLVGMVQVL